MSGPSTVNLTELLVAWSAGDEGALTDLTPLVYQELHQLAHRYLDGEKHKSLQTTELVNEAFVRLVDNEISWAGRAHFYVVAARTMRRVLIDLARRRRAEKRDGVDRQVSLWDSDGQPLGLPSSAGSPVDLLALNQALQRLESADPRKGRAIELRYFGGLAVAELARVLEISVPTAERDLRLAKAWLRQALRDSSSNDS